MFQEAGDGWGASLALLILADLINVNRQDPEQAASTYQQSLDGFTRLGNDWGRGLCFFGLGMLAGFGGRPAKAGHLFQQSLEIYLRLGNMNRVLDTREALGQIAAAQGQVDQARRFFLANLAYLEQTGDQERIRIVQDRLARL